MLLPLFKSKEVTYNDLNLRYCSLSEDLDPEIFERQTVKKEIKKDDIIGFENGFNTLSKETNQAFFKYFGQHMATFNKT